MAGRSAVMNGLIKAASATQVAVYRWSRGKIGKSSGGIPILLLTTTGRRTGKARTRPLGFGRDGPAFIVVGSNGGYSVDPSWVGNLAAAPQARVELGSEVLEVTAQVAAGDERERLWISLCSQYPLYAKYALKTSRELPVVCLRPIS